jgi:hypothetical protein
MRMRVARSTVGAVGGAAAGVAENTAFMATVQAAATTTRLAILCV